MMDCSLRAVLHSCSTPSSHHIQTRLLLFKQSKSSLHNNNSSKPNFPNVYWRSPASLGRLSRVVSAGVSSVQTREEEKKKMGDKVGRGKVRIHFRIDHQVQFGEHIVMLGSTKELGSWKKNVPLRWTEKGWVCDLDFKGGGTVEFKFIIVGKDKNVIWESGNNRALKLPEGGRFEVVSKWDSTAEDVKLAQLIAVDESDVGVVEDAGNGGASGGYDAAPSEAEASPFVEQWQGKSTSFMRSNEHGSRETQRRWDTSGLEGVALKLVEGDQHGRNWWRKVLPYNHYKKTKLFPRHKMA